MSTDSLVVPMIPSYKDCRETKTGLVLYSICMNTYGGDTYFDKKMFR